MILWSTKRRFIYGGSFLFVVAMIFSVVFYSVFHRTPTCSDGIQNGLERGIDCGGACKNLCTSDALNPVVIWSKVFNISGDVYSAVAYVENPNINSKNAKAGYTFRIFDASNQLITVKDGETSIPKGRRFAIFESGIVMKGSKPKSVEFKFTSFSPWEKDTQKEPNLSVVYGTLTSTTTAPRIEGTVTNNSLTSSPDLELAIFVIDSKENVVAASHTFVDSLTSRGSHDFVFTWPKPFSLGAESCTNPLDIALVLDTSASMTGESSLPPEPWSTIKATTQSFLKNLVVDSKVSILSFNSSTKEESPLSSDVDSNVFAIENIAVATTGEQTNISEALNVASSKLNSAEARKDSKKVLILLTDGVPTEPKLESASDYPFTSAQSIARGIVNSGINIYTIGLGKNINTDFLKSISGFNTNYFSAPNKEALKDVYNRIISSVCVKKPSLVNIIYRPI